MNFVEILGNDNVKNMLNKSIENKNISHSYMFIGNAGVGKRQVAKAFARKVLCQNDTSDECECSSCVKFDSGNHPDFYEIEPEGASVKIEQIRQLQNAVYEKPIQSSKKVYIINESEKMTTEASNCLLKTLEEPPEYAVLILITENESALLSTIKSRCLKVNFEKIDNGIIKKYSKEKYDVEPTETQLEYINGSIGKIEVLYKDKEQYDEIEEIFSNIDSKNILNVLNKLDILYKNKENIYEVLDYLSVVIYKNSNDNLRKFDRIQKINSVKLKIRESNNYDMCIDSLLFGMWED